ncbi:hypothetical protein B0H17DRAFT_1326149 [Mycena rosella]|uniref:RNA helicase n=1 Tax=Mycena rosella TaxID=1033263 RepID=A0AAD7GU01_MYCRO|nr:hypothetical protein B0H17DRAFT_1326149 [Mycena rosella]
MSIWARRAARTRPCARDEGFTTLFHSSATVSWKKKKRVSEILTPSLPSGSTQVSIPARRHGETRPAFVRDALPHADVDVESAPAAEATGRNPSFRRRSPARNEQDWNRRTGRWSVIAFGGGGYRGFHSSATVSWKKKRVSEILEPSSPSGSSENPTRRRGETRPAFVRDALPHADVEHAPAAEGTGRNPSFRRRSPARNERDWDQRTGRWSASRFGGGEYRGSQMGLREDRPSSYGLEGSSSNEFSRPRETPFRRAEGGAVRFGLRPEGPRRVEHYESGPSFGRRSDTFQPESPSSYTRRPPRPLDADESFPRRPQNPFPNPTSPRPSSGFQNSFPSPTSGRPSSASQWDSEDSRNSTSQPLPETDDLEASSTLKNRNQVSVVAPPATPPASKSKSKPQTPPSPPKKDHPNESPFYNPPVVLARAGVPIIAKSDPTTASTTFSYSPAMSQKNDLPTRFTSPPLLPGLLKCVTDVVGTSAPTHIQALSLKWVVEPWTAGQENLPTPNTEELGITVSSESSKPDYKEFLLSAETGSGKSVAYLLPVLQALKLSEARRAAEEATPIASKRGLNPRALILLPTHELARQVSGSAKALLHDVKLRVLCASRANEPTRAARDPTVKGKGKKSSSASRMKELLSFADDGKMGEFQVTETDLSTATFPVDVVVGTPMKLMEMVRGRGWERDVEFGGGVASTKMPEPKEKKDPSDDDAESKERGPKLRRGRDPTPGVGKWRSSPEMGLSEVEWVVVDEADVLFDPDFQETTRMLLADIAKARGHDIPFTPLPVGLMAPGPPASVPMPTTSRQKEKEKKEQEKEKEKEKEAAQGKIVVKRGPSAITPLNYPFNFLVVSATIPNSLSSYLNAYHPRILRLVTPHANHIPKTVRMEYVNWTGGNKNADIERRLRKVWAGDAADGLGPVPDSLGDMSKVLIFCNKNTKVQDLGEFLEEKGIKNVQLSSSSPNRKRGNNKHLGGFIKTNTPDENRRPDDWSSSWVAEEADEPAIPKVVKKKEPKKGSLVPVSKNDPPATEPINDPMNIPHVMITTSLLSRGLDFSPNVKHVFIIDEPRNMTDFLHRAGRTGRAGQHGKVVIFGTMEGRGSQRSKEIRKKIKALAA